MPWLGIDIGGANIKLADGQGFADVRPFALWKEPQRLAFELRTCIAHAPDCDHLAVTMTAELADCFANKAEGVKFLLQALADASDRRHTRVYLRTGVFVAPQVAIARPADAAAANWHALARFAARYVEDEPAIVLDIGSTTTDIVPLVRGQVTAKGTSDTERLLAGELVYTGVERSPVCALVETVPFRDQVCPVAQELFATMQDVYVILGDMDESTSAEFSADGRPRLKVWARARLARMICADVETFSYRDAVAMSQAVAAAQVRRIAAGMKQVMAAQAEAPRVCILSGHGEFLARRVLQSLPWTGKVISLEKELGSRASRCAPAHAVAVLAHEAASP
jgi:probable H4MPT-linked C1 transfer pathway protein